MKTLKVRLLSFSTPIGNQEVLLTGSGRSQQGPKAKRDGSVLRPGEDRSRDSLLSLWRLVRLKPDPLATIVDPVGLAALRSARYLPRPEGQPLLLGPANRAVAAGRSRQSFAAVSFSLNLDLAIGLAPVQAAFSAS